MIEVLNLTEIMELALKITLIFYGVFVFYLFGKFQKIPYSARQTIFVIGNGGCLFLAGGLITSNFFLIKGGIFILVIHALIDAHYLISRYEMFKELEKDEKKSNEKK